jgi:capsular exopolysaccharide synthesis family protein
MQASPGPGQPDLLSLLKALWRRKWLFLGIVVLIPAAVYAISITIPKTYEAEALIRVQPTAVTLPTTAPGTPTGINTEALLVESEETAEEAAKELGEPTSKAGELSDKIDATPPEAAGGTPATDLLSLVAQASSANRAAEIANAFASAADTVRTSKAQAQIERQMARLEAQRSQITDPVAEQELERQLQTLRAARAAQEDTTTLLQPAFAPEYPISPHPRRNTALAGVVALLLGLLAVAFRERTDRRLREQDELEPLFGAPLLSVIPTVAFPGGRPALEGAREPFRREPFRTLAASLVYFNIDRPLGTVMIASPTKGDGKTTVATYLSIALARDGQDVVLVDCDLRRPQVASRLGVDLHGGLEDVLTSRADVDDVLVEVNVGEGRLLVLGCATPPPNPARLIGSASMNSLLIELSERADIVIIDTPPILHVSDAVPLLERVSGIVVVARLDFTSKDAVARLRQVIDSARGDVLGTVATGAKSSGLYGYGYYDYGRDLVKEPAPTTTDETERAPSTVATAAKAPSKSRPRSRSASRGGNGSEEERESGKRDGAGSSDETVERDAVASEMKAGAKRPASPEREA